MLLKIKPFLETIYKRTFYSKTNLIIVLILLASALVALRTIHLGADTPPWVSSNVGLYVDEGYKTLSPRNLVLFGSEHWHPEDDYFGWTASSPVTQWCYYLSFKLLGVSIESARIVSIVMFLILLSTFCIAMFTQYPPRILLVGLIMLGLQNTIFFFSRIALFEIAVILLIYASIFILKPLGTSRPFFSLLIVLGTGFLATVAVKQTAAIFLASALIGIFISFAIARGWFVRFRPALAILGLTAAAIAVIIFVKLDYLSLGSHWYFIGSGIRRMDIFPISEIIKRMSYYPPSVSDPFIVILGLMCAFEGLHRRPHVYICRLYPSALLGIMLFSPLLLALFPHSLVRYYLPVIPAYILFFLEWWDTKDQHPNPHFAKSKLLYLLKFWILLCVVFYSLQALRGVLFQEFPKMLSNQALILTFLAALAVTAGFHFSKYHHKFLSKALSNQLISAVLLLFLVFNSAQIFRFVYSPSYQARDISEEIKTIVPKEATIAGDWAPLFGLGTDLRVLYMETTFNVPDRLESLKPSFFLHSDTPESHESMRTISGLNGVTLGPAVLRSRYNGKDVALYPVVYKTSSVPRSVDEP